MNAKVDAFILRAKKWRGEFEKLREIALACDLVEELKWGKPCYTNQGNNIIVVQGFKEFCALLFPKGALLKDPKGILEKPGENTQSARRVRFTSAEDVDKLKTSLKALIREAIAVEQAGEKVKFKKITEFAIPAELQSRLKANAGLKKAWFQLTPGRQRAYLLHISAAKQSTTRASRVEKCIPAILDGKGPNDR